MASDPSVLLALAARAEAGTWSREDDATLVEQLGGKVHTDREWRLVTSFDGTPDGALVPIWHYDKSIDAQAELPGEIYGCRRSFSEGTTWRWEAFAGGPHVGRAPTEPLARLSALLRAMAAAAQESGDGR